MDSKDKFPYDDEDIDDSEAFFEVDETSAVSKSERRHLARKAIEARMEQKKLQALLADEYDFDDEE